MSTLGTIALILFVVVAAVLVIIGGMHIGNQRLTAMPGGVLPAHPRWFEILLALVLLGAMVALGLTLVFDVWEERTLEQTWRSGVRATVFLSLMLVAVALGLLFLITFLIARMPRMQQATPTPSAQEAGEARESPAGARLSGLLLLGIGILLLGWLYLEPAARAELLSGLLYPAAIAVAVVLLLDKATRAWEVKSTAESIREWLLGDLMVIALILGFLNVSQFEDRENYAGLLWDMLHIVAFFAVFWFLDRTRGASRFLVAAGYLTLLPLLLLLWRWTHQVEVPVEDPWWRTIWPIFFLSLAFFVLEVIALLALRGARDHPLPAIKDAVFVIVFGAFLIAALPSTE